MPELIFLNGEEIEKRSDDSALDLITRLLNAEEWDSDTVVAVADVVRETGRTIAGVDY